ncbi:hypothetical protein [Thalassobellus suaedae]|uniref:Sulfotransferase domain-containing protein n=1 Tax=Thalassobellus suaedae TaxID=3074124 RepID=A0ABY9Y141_9FLAO|nr:hypothetical protein RHP49_12000 [Flavobacteriaceae bacterium HL-DH10]
MKTGTSAIQKFVQNNLQYLKSKNLFYSETNIKAQNYLAFSLMNEVPSYVQQVLPEKAERLYGKLIDEIIKSKQDRILISTEIYSLISCDHFLGYEVPKRLFEFFKGYGFNFKIILFLRRQDEFLLSMYNQIIKRHNFNNLYSNDIMSYYEDNQEIFDYEYLINKWSNVFGLENMIIKPFNKKDSIVDSFFKIFNIDTSKCIDNIGVNNKSLGSKSIEFMRLANQFNINKHDGGANNTLINLIRDAISIEGELELEIKDSSLILSKYNKLNTNISNTFFKGDTSWFNYQDTSIINENKNLKLEIDDVVSIAVNIWNYFQKNNNA